MLSAGVGNSIAVAHTTQVMREMRQTHARVFLVSLTYQSPLTCTGSPSAVETLSDTFILYYTSMFIPCQEIGTPCGASDEDSTLHY